MALRTTAPGDTALRETVPTDTRPGDTGLTDTRPRDTGLTDTGTLVRVRRRSAVLNRDTAAPGTASRTVPEAAIPARLGTPVPGTAVPGTAAATRESPHTVTGDSQVA